MAASRAAWYGSLLALAIWVARALLLWQAGGLDRAAGEGLLFVVGLLTYLGAAMALGAALAVTRPLGIRAIAAATVAVLALVPLIPLSAAADALVPVGNGRPAEVAAPVLAALMLAVAARFARRRADRHTAATLE